MEWVELILGFIGGGFVSVLTIPSIIKKSKAEARAAEIENMKSVADGWKELSEERQEANKEKDARIAELTKQVDERYEDIGAWRDKCASQQEEITSLKVQIASQIPKICEKRGCDERTPPTGY